MLTGRTQSLPASNEVTHVSGAFAIVVYLLVS
jgi:hypothetical protein